MPTGVGAAWPELFEVLTASLQETTPIPKPFLELSFVEKPLATR